MKQIVIENCIYNIDPIYTLYAASEDAKRIHIVKQKPIIGRKHSSGYMMYNIRKHGEKTSKCILFITLLGKVLMELYQIINNCIA